MACDIIYYLCCWLLVSIFNKSDFNVMVYVFGSTMRDRSEDPSHLSGRSTTAQHHTSLKLKVQQVKIINKFVFILVCC